MNYIQIGKITGTHGLDGNVSIFHSLGKLSGIKQLKHVFIELKRESYIPFFIEKMKTDNAQELFVKLEEVDSVEAAKAISGKMVYLSTEQYEKLKPKDNEINFVGFEVWDQEIGKLGIVDQLLETPGQLLASLNYQKKEVIIPLNDQTILSVDIPTKKLTLNLPSGLLDVYLES